MVANPAVVLKFPVTVELPPGIRSKRGINPIKLQVRINIKYVVIRGVQNLPFVDPMLGITISFRIKFIKISYKWLSPSGSALSDCLYLLVP